MVTYKEKVEGCLYLASLLETLGYYNAMWEFNFGNKIDTLKEGLIMNYFFLNHYNMLGGLNNIDFSKLFSSDDTILIIATMEALLNNDKNRYINSYLKYLPKLKEDKRQSGYATLSSLEKIRVTKNIKDIKYSSNMGGNGCAIRTAPIGLKYYKDYEKVCEEALLASIVTHNFATGFLGGIVTALFTAYAINNINPFEWSLKLEDLHKKNFFNNLIKKHITVDSIKDLTKDINDFFLYWEKYNEERLTKMKIRKLPRFLNPASKIEDLTTYFPTPYLSRLKGFDKMGASGLECVILAYDNLLLSAVPDENLMVDIVNPKFNWETLLFNNIFFYGDNDSISAVSAGWYGAYLGIDKFPIEKIKQLEFYNDIKKLIENFL